MGRPPFLEKNVFNFSWARKHQKRPPFPHAAAFHLPSRIGLNKTFLETQLSIHAATSKKKKSESKPFMNFSCLASWILHIFCFPYVDFFSSRFSDLIVVYLNTISLNPIWCICFERPANVFCFGNLQQSVWHLQCSEIHKFLCVYVILGVCYILINPRI